MPAPLYRGLACGDCDRVFSLQTPRLGACPVCDSALRITMKPPTVSNAEAFELWDAARVENLERALSATSNAGEARP